MRKKILIWFLLLTFFACSVGCDNKEGKEIKTPDKKHEEKQEKEEEQNLIPEEDNPEVEYELYTDDKKMVFKDGNNYSVYYYTGTQVTGYHYYIDYKTEASASEALTNYEKPKNVDKITANGRFLILEYNKSEYKDLTVYKLRNVYGDLEQSPEK